MLHMPFVTLEIYAKELRVSCVIGDAFSMLIRKTESNMGLKSVVLLTPF